MGERSQIYIRFRTKESARSKYSNEGLVARYYQWSFGERMISRCRGLVEHLQHACRYCYQLTNSPRDIEKIVRIADTNFDMRDVMISDDILAETVDTIREGHKASVFSQDNNHGQIYIDVLATPYRNKYWNIKYAFVEWHDKPVMDVEQFANWDMGNDNEWRDEGKPVRKWDEPSDYYRDNMAAFEELVAYTRANISKIGEIATVMSDAEKDEFVQWADAYATKVAGA